MYLGTEYYALKWSILQNQQPVFRCPLQTVENVELFLKAKYTSHSSHNRTFPGDWLATTGRAVRSGARLTFIWEFRPANSANMPLRMMKLSNQSRQKLAAKSDGPPCTVRTLKSIRSSFLGSRFFLDPIRALISLADMLRFSPARSDARRLN